MIKSFTCLAVPQRGRTDESTQRWKEASESALRSAGKEKQLPAMSGDAVTARLELSIKGEERITRTLNNITQLLVRKREIIGNIILLLEHAFRLDFALFSRAVCLPERKGAARIRKGLFAYFSLTSCARQKRDIVHDVMRYHSQLG
uniref:Uncharacterized protein n=1 Tax=Sphaerodactylus townsendi TaxID=933632 RepID=A0ACB8E6K1_9SAUR